ncbi:DUF4222 domain-containing protein [Enterobacter ludwigii]|uniref:DUF4222 domain-containing protein n=1 Tax=Enterobacter ludwigii TaxID=299767 RepID=UPI000642BE3C|nr:DUF4222 domain-containing protein [Enterobacter ludwigii]KLP39508.1 hypothetical protein ABR36_10885 [Enterobacter ludwigii]
MKNKNSGLNAGGPAQSEIRPGDKWRDNSGSLVTVTGYAFNRVTYVRDGYEHPCVFPVDRFRREFTRAEGQTFTEWRAAANPLEKTRKLRELINARRGGSQ